MGQGVGDRTVRRLKGCEVRGLEGGGVKVLGRRKVRVSEGREVRKL